MTSAADAGIAALRAVHDELAARVAGYSDDDLVRPSGATQWSIAQVLSHLGSGAEIARAGLAGALVGASPMERSAYQAIWDRWNAMSPRRQAEESVGGDAELVANFEALDEDTRNSLRVKLPFLPEPIGVDLLAALRLNESALHGWDVAVADDGSATLTRAAVPVLVDALSGPLAFFIGFLGKGRSAAGVLAVSTTEPDRQLTVKVGDQVALIRSAPDSPDGTLALPAEALFRLLTGRLPPDRTPPGVTVTGPLDLAALRTVFPGF